MHAHHAQRTRMLNGDDLHVENTRTTASYLKLMHRHLINARTKQSMHAHSIDERTLARWVFASSMHAPFIVQICPYVINHVIYIHIRVRDSVKRISCLVTPCCHSDENW